MSLFFDIVKAIETKEQQDIAALLNELQRAHGDNEEQPSINPLEYLYSL